MRIIHKIIPAAVLILLTPLMYGDNSNLTVTGDYLLYSYDHNFLFGRGNILLSTGDIHIRCIQIEGDIKKGILRLSGNCRFIRSGRETRVDEMIMDPVTLCGRTVSFEDEIKEEKIHLRQPCPKSPETGPKSRTMQELRQSLIYFEGREVHIRPNLDVIGHNVTIFVESIQSLTFKKFKMNRGIPDSSSYISLNKLWYYESQGVMADIVARLEKKLGKSLFSSHNRLKTQYDLFNQKMYGPDWEFFLDSRNTYNIQNRHTVHFNVKHITDNMTGLSLGSQVTPAPCLKTSLNIDYQKPHSRSEELWFNGFLDFQMKKLGTAIVKLDYEKQNQYNGSVSYSLQSIKNLQLAFGYAISRLLSNETSISKRSTTEFSLSYSTKIFKLDSRYTLHKDLISDSSQSNPQINLHVTPFTLYGGLLRFNVTSALNLNFLESSGTENFTYTANSALDITTEKLSLSPSTEMEVSIRTEQFYGEDALNNTTSAGLVLKTRQHFGNIGFLDILYTYQTRRNTEAWFIQGSTSQDVTALFKIREKTQEDNLSFWTSLTYNPKTGEFSTGYLDFQLKIIKKWYIQTLLNYDFEFDRFGYDLYLKRKAGRILFRVTYRSLSKRFQFEILTAS